MKVVEYLKANGLQALKDELAIKVKEYPEHGLMVLNYDQIESPKTHPVVMECRGLILDSNTYNVVSRSFDRFFNLNEADTTSQNIDFARTRVFEKVDGSLIKLYCHKGFWHIATRGTAFAETEVNDQGATFRDLVLKALGLEEKGAFQEACQDYLLPELTYICEVTSRENRVVKPYDGYMLHFLAARCNKTGEYFVDEAEGDAIALGCEELKEYTFDTIDHCIWTANVLKDLDEGYVLYNKAGGPICKIKSPQYVAVHRLKGEGLNLKRVLELVLLGEEEEYLDYFPEDEKYVMDIKHCVSEDLLTSDADYFNSFSYIEDQKEFALQVKDRADSALMFMAKKSGKSPSKCFMDNWGLNKKVKYTKERLKDEDLSVY